MSRTADQIRDISVEVYKKLLAASAGGSDAAWRADEWKRMVAKDKDDDQKLRNRAGAYDHVVRAVLEVIDAD